MSAFADGNVRNIYSLVSMTIAEPRQTSTCVLIPAPRRFRPRSIPMNIPTASENSRRIQMPTAVQVAAVSTIHFQTAIFLPLPARKTSKTQPFFAPQDSSMTDIGIFYETKKSRKHPYFYVCLSALNLTGFIISNLLTFCQSVSMLRRTEDPVRM